MSAKSTQEGGRGLSTCSKGNTEINAFSEQKKSGGWHPRALTYFIEENTWMDSLSSVLRSRDAILGTLDVRSSSKNKRWQTQSWGCLI